MSPGLLDWPAEAVRLLDGQASGWLPPLVRLAAWGAASGAASMLLYRAVSSQDKIRRAREAAAAARGALARYDGEAAGLAPLAGSALRLAGRYVGLVIGPTLVAALPVAIAIAGLGERHDRRPPEPGERVEVRWFPAAAALAWQPVESARRLQAPGALEVSWPAEPGGVVFRDGAGAAVATLPLSAAVTALGRKPWWHRLAGSRGGYLPDGSDIERMEFRLPPRQHLDRGPEWMRGWLAPFLGATAVAALALKRVYRIA